MTGMSSRSAVVGVIVASVVAYAVLAATRR